MISVKFWVNTHKFTRAGLEPTTGRIDPVTFPSNLLSPSLGIGAHSIIALVVLSPELERKLAGWDRTLSFCWWGRTEGKFSFPHQCCYLQPEHIPWNDDDACVVVVKLASTPMMDTHDTEFVNWLLTTHLFKDVSRSLVSKHTDFEIILLTVKQWFNRTPQIIVLSFFIKK